MQSCSRTLFAASIVLLGLIGVKSSSKVCQKIVDEPAPNYCDQWGKKHLACNAEKGEIKCGGETAEIWPISDSLQARIVKQHNVYRNMVARGNFKQLPIAARMLRIKWDDNLAYLASMAIRKCSLSIPSDLLYPTTSASKPAYNAAYNKYHESIPQNELQIVTSQIKSWFDQIKYVDIHGLHGNKSTAGQEIGHFKHLMTGLNDRVGCAILKYPEGHWRIQLMICFYGCHKQENKMTYDLGKLPGDKCQCGSDRHFKNLCDKSERYGDCALIKDKNLEDNLMTTSASTSKKRRSRLEAELLGKIREWVLDQNYSSANSLEVTTDL